MAYQQLLCIGPDLLDPAISAGVLMARMMPMVAVTGMNFLVHELDATAPVKVVPEAGAFAHFPDPLDLFAPTGFHDLVQVQADANVDVFGDQGQGCVSGMVKAPRRNADVVDHNAVLTGQFHHAVCRAGVGNE